MNKYADIHLMLGSDSTPRGSESGQVIKKASLNTWNLNRGWNEVGEQAVCIVSGKSVPAYGNSRCRGPVAGTVCCVQAIGNRGCAGAGGGRRTQGSRVVVGPGTRVGSQVVS